MFEHLFPVVVLCVVSLLAVFAVGEIFQWKLPGWALAVQPRFRLERFEWSSGEVEVETRSNERPYFVKVHSPMATFSSKVIGRSDNPEKLTEMAKADLVKQGWRTVSYDVTDLKELCSHSTVARSPRLDT
jgi:hypothetical protein